MAKIFLGYSRKDINAMQLAKKTLTDSGVSVWTDENLKPGTQSWIKGIDLALKECRAVVVILSPDAYRSEWVGREISKAMAYGKKIIPLLLRGNPVDAHLSCSAVQKENLSELSW